jgi:peptidylprolyl isomerase
MAEKIVEKGNTVLVEYTGKLETGETFDSSKGKEPLEFVVGAGSVIPGFDEGILGMKVGQEKSISISPEKGYGTRHEEYIKEVPIKTIPKELEVRLGMILLFKRPDGMDIPCVVKEIGKENIKVDFNHPLAGKKLIFDVKVMEIKQ